MRVGIILRHKRRRFTVSDSPFPISFARKPCGRNSANGEFWLGKPPPHLFREDIPRYLVTKFEIFRKRRVRSLFHASSSSVYLLQLLRRLVLLFSAIEFSKLAIPLRAKPLNHVVIAFANEFAIHAFVPYSVTSPSYRLSIEFLYYLNFYRDI